MQQHAHFDGEARNDQWWRDIRQGLFFIVVFFFVLPMGISLVRPGQFWQDPIMNVALLPYGALWDGTAQILGHQAAAEVFDLAPGDTEFLRLVTTVVLEAILLGVLLFVFALVARKTAWALFRGIGAVVVLGGLLAVAILWILREPLSWALPLVGLAVVVKSVLYSKWSVLPDPTL